MQWQHGRFYMDANGSLILQPIAVDGRQLLSEPCTYSNGIYTRYNQSELFLVCENSPFPNLKMVVATAAAAAKLMFRVSTAI